MRVASRAAASVLLVPFLALAGCKSDPSQFYRLTPLAAGEGQAAALSPTARTVGVGPIEIPEYLDRVQIVTLDAGSRIKVAENDRWAEPLDDGITRTLVENLAVLLPDRVVTANSTALPSGIDTQVFLDVSSIDIAPGKTVTLNVFWRIVASDGSGRPLQGRSVIAEPLATPDYNGAAVALSRALDKLSRELAATLKRA